MFVSKRFCFRTTYVSLTWLMLVLVLVFPMLYFLLIKKRRSTALLALLALYSFCHGLRSIFYEFHCFIPLFPVLLMSMALFFALLRCLVGCGGVVPCPPFFMFPWPKCWLVISLLTLIALAWLYLGLF